jgi:DNA topoisomerase-3
MWDQLAEKLYQKGFLSYPRTETDQYDKDFDFNSLIQKQTYDNTWGAFAQRQVRLRSEVSCVIKLTNTSLLDGGFQKPRNGRKNDKAHPPIHPTNSANNLEADERRVYELVTRRFLASCSKNAEGKTTTVEINIADEFFSTSGASRGASSSDV